MAQYMYGPMEGATSSTAGEKGLVPKPAAGDQGKFLKGDGTWGNEDVSGKQDKTDNSLDTTAKTIVGAINEHEGDITSLNSKLNSNANSTNDILADALNCTESKFFNGSGGSYTGTVPSTNFKWATFMVNVKGTIKYVIAHAPENKIAINVYDNGAWQGWQELALKSSLFSIKTVSFANSAIPANDVFSVSKAVNADTGYTPLCVAGFGLARLNGINFTGIYVSGSNVVVMGYNATSATTFNGDVVVLCVKS